MMKYDEMDAKIGATIKRYRNERKLTVRDVGEMLKIDNSTVTRWESGENAIRARDLLHYLDRLGYTYEKFISDLKKLGGNDNGII